MRIAITGGTGFLGRYIVRHFGEAGHDCLCWYRESSDRGGFEDIDARLTWVPGRLGNDLDARRLVMGADCVIHAALERAGPAFRGGEGDIVDFAQANVVGTLRLIKAAIEAGVEQFIFISTCAVHEVIMADRALDEAHPMWPSSHYGAHKAAIEEFVYSYGIGHGFNICALRPTGIYGAARPRSRSKWYELVQAVKRGEAVSTARGGKEVHAADVARACEVLMDAPAEDTMGQAFNCYDMYVPDEEVARIAKALTGSRSEIAQLNAGPKNQIDTSKLRRLGMAFGGRTILEATIRELVEG